MRRISKVFLLFAFLSVAFSVQASAQTYEVTTCGADGRTGPSQSQCDSAYSGTALEGEVSVVGEGIQEWRPSTTRTYNITCAGAQGGDDGGSYGGYGAVISAEIEMNSSTTYQILVGQEGGYAENTKGIAGGGGGGTFIIEKSSDDPVLICGGGGGVSYIKNKDGFDIETKPGLNASFSTSGKDGTENPDSWNAPGEGGINGDGGDKIGDSGAGGGGFYTNGGGSSDFAGEGGEAFLNGGTGGVNREYSGGFVTDEFGGGFGGGAGGAVHDNYEINAGGGGGYSGGGGGATRAGSGGGGGSFVIDSAKNQTNIGYNAGSGYIDISSVTSKNLDFCNFRGPVNECVMNETNQLNNQKYNVSSIFESRSNAVFEAFNGAATLNLTNSSHISGLWRGAIRIEAKSPRLKAGASFRPQGERIVIGE